MDVDGAHEFFTCPTGSEKPSTNTSLMPPRESSLARGRQTAVPDPVEDQRLATDDAVLRPRRSRGVDAGSTRGRSATFPVVRFVGLGGVREESVDEDRRGLLQVRCEERRDAVSVTRERRGHETAMLAPDVPSRRGKRNGQTPVPLAPRIEGRADLQQVPAVASGGECFVEGVVGVRPGVAEAPLVVRLALRRA